MKKKKRIDNIHTRNHLLKPTKDAKRSTQTGFEPAIFRVKEIGEPKSDAIPFRHQAVLFLDERKAAYSAFCTPPQ